MSIATEITRLQGAKADLKTAIEGKGVTVPAAALLDDYADLVDAIQTGGGGLNLNEFFSGRTTTIEDDSVTSLRPQAFREYAALTTVKLHNVTSMNNGSFYNCHGLTALAFPLLVGAVPTAITNCNNIEKLDFGSGITSFAQGAIANNPKLNVLVIRNSTAVVPIGANTLNGTCFKSGGEGGTVYIPNALYAHLGDGTSLDYKNSTNWATFDSYGTITWAKIEGSQYENYYADGTPIT